MRTIQILRMHRKLDGDLWLNAKKKKIGSLWLHVATAFVLLYETEG